MKIIYIANSRIPTEKAHGIQIMNMCEAFSNQGIDVELVVPWRFNPIKEDPFKYYGVEKIFKIKKLPSIDLVKLGKIGFLVQSLSFAKCAFWCVLFKKADIIYSRDELPLFFLSFFKKNLFWEGHDGRYNFVIRRILKKCRGIITITEGLKNFYIEKGANEEKISVAPSGVDLEKFNLKISQKEAREELMKRNPKINLPQDKKIILYVGSLYEWKGVDYVLSVPQEIKDALFIFVGGPNELIQTYDIKKSSNETSIFVGFKSHQDIPYWLKAADILILPNTSKSDISKLYTSPLKMFEYMASGTPIVAFDIPSIKEVLNEKNAFLANPDSLASFMARIEKALKDKDLSAKIAEQARLDVQKYTWDNRAKNILEFIKNHV